MTTTLLLALALSSLKIEPARVEVPQVKQVKVDLALPSLPEAEGLHGPGSRQDLASRQAVESRTLEPSPVRVEEVQLGKSFAATSRGLRALEPVDSFLVRGLPAQLPPLKLCVRVASPDKMPARVRLQIRLPGGAELLSFSKTASFEKEWADVLFDLGALKVRQAGAYTLVVSVDGEVAARLPLQIKQVRRAAQSPGR